MLDSNNHIYPWGNSRRFFSWADYCRREYGGRIQKVAVNAGMSCPNRDGTLGTGGCTFCNNQGFSPSYCEPGKPIVVQIEQGLAFLKKRYRKTTVFVAYFQAYTNTHAPLLQLKGIYEQALTHPEISGIVVGTRPDCVDEEKLDYLASLSEKTFVKVEYGVESCYDQTLLRVNRGHTFGDAVRAIEMTAERGLLTGIHLIVGLPGESREQILAQADMINALPIHSVKLHQLQIVKGTPVADEYSLFPHHFQLFGLEEYLSFMVQFLERLRPDIAVERFSGEVHPRFNAGPSWGMLRTDQVLRMLEDRLLEKDTWQGRLFV
jgi:uncharacterized protein